MATLVVAEHNNASLADATSKTVSAAKMLGGDVDILVAGKDASAAADAAKAIDGVRAVVEDASLAPAVRGELTKLLRGLDMGFAGARDWTQMHRNLFRALKTEKIVMFSILAIAIGIAAFNIVSILVMAVIEKRPDIAMLGSLGMERGALMRVFLIQGGITGIVGVAVGLGVGVVLATGGKRGFPAPS